jgi:hypothetical protein
MSSIASSGRSSRRIVCVRSLRLRPSRRAKVAAVTPNSFRSAAIVRASSITPRSSRATFSISASSTDCLASTGCAMSVGIVAMPAILDARQRRSPAISSYPPAVRGWTMTGCNTPRSRIESASAVSEASSKRLRGWDGLG